MDLSLFWAVDGMLPSRRMPGQNCLPPLKDWCEQSAADFAESEIHDLSSNYDFLSGRVWIPGFSAFFADLISSMNSPARHDAKGFSEIFRAPSDNSHKFNNSGVKHMPGFLAGGNDTYYVCT
jgi:hypothetical protein